MIVIDKYDYDDENDYDDDGNKILKLNDDFI